jgi:hypothetical protein
MRRAHAPAVLIVSASLLVACAQPAPGPGVTAVRIEGGDRTLPVGASVVLTSTVETRGGAASTVSWKSGDAGVVSVDPAGKAVAHVEGAAPITAISTFDATKSATITVTAAYAVEGTIVGLEGAGNVGVALVLMDDPVDMLLSRSALVDMGDGSYLGPVGQVGADGSFTLPFPILADLPPTLFAPADDFVVNARSTPGCGLTASDPEARVTTTFFAYFVAPILVLVHDEGFDLVIVFEQPVDFADDEAGVFDASLVTWVHATRPVSVATSGDGCATDEYTFEVEVGLEAGWNQVAWIMSEDAGSQTVALRLQNSDVEEVFGLAFLGH